jgi:hypothetical protein
LFLERFGRLLRLWRRRRRLPLLLLADRAARQ